MSSYFKLFIKYSYNLHTKIFIIFLLDIKMTNNDYQKQKERPQKEVREKYQNFPDGK